MKETKVQFVNLIELVLAHNSYSLFLSVLPAVPSTLYYLCPEPFPVLYTNPNLLHYRILVPEYGFMHLELIPMLVGFFTYKIATFFQAIEEALTVSGEKRQA